MINICAKGNIMPCKKPTRACLDGNEHARISQDKHSSCKIIRENLARYTSGLNWGNGQIKIMPTLVEKTEQKRRKKCSVCSVFYVRNGRHVGFVRYDRFQMKQIVGMFGLESKKASVCSVLRDSVCLVRNVRKTLTFRVFGI